MSSAEDLAQDIFSTAVLAASARRWVANWGNCTINANLHKRTQGSGNLGSAVVKEFLASDFKVSVLSRGEPKNPLP